MDAWRTQTDTGVFGRPSNARIACFLNVAGQVARAITFGPEFRVVSGCYRSTLRRRHAPTENYLSICEFPHEPSGGLHPRRVAGGDHDHWHSAGTFVAGGAVGSGSRSSLELHEQY